MKNISRILILAVAIITLSSCNNDKFSFLKEYPTQTVPLIDSTNFNNHIEGKSLTKEQQKLLKLPLVFEEQLNDKNARIGISYLPKLSENYTSVVYYFYPSKTGLISMLVNYDKNFEVINSQVLAYNEVTESMLKSTSKLTKNSIELSEYVFDQASVIKFKISENGNITRE